MFVLVTVVTLTLLLSALCSLLEAVLYSTRLATLEAAISEGRNKRAAESLLEMKRKIAIPTAAILILNTVANTAGATVAGMYASELLSARFGHWGVYVFSGFLTVAILFLSEILPKTYGAIHWKKVWPWTVRPLHSMRTVLSPAIWVTQKFTDSISRKGPSSSVTEEDILGMIRLGAREGELTPEKLHLLDGVFRFGDAVCRQVMAPRNTVLTLDVSHSFKEALEIIRGSKHARYPLCRGSLDDVVGVIHVKDLLGLPEDKPVDLAALARPIERVPETLPVSDVLRQMQQSRKHMAAVVDEHGTVSGVVMLEKVLEQIVGDIQDEFDREEVEIQNLGTGKFKLLGRVSLDRMNRQLDLDLEAPGVDTLSGLLVTKLNRLPRVGDRVKLDGANVEVLEVVCDRATLVRLVLEARPNSESDDSKTPASPPADA